MQNLDLRACKERGCQKPIVFVKTPNGHMMPIDGPSAKCRGCDHPHMGGACREKDPLAPGVQLLACDCKEFDLGERWDPTRMVSHFATCIAARRFRKDPRAQRGGGA